MQVVTIFKKEIASYIKSGSGFVIAGLFFLVHGIFFSMYTLHYGFTDYSYTLAALEVSFLAVIPLMTMGLAAGERSAKTDILLFTAPLTSAEIAAGKYLAAVTVAAALTAAVTVIPFAVVPPAQLPAAKTLAAAAGFFLEWCAFAVVGLCVSCTAKTKVSAAAVTFCWILCFTLLDSLTLLLPRSAAAGLIAVGAGILAAAVMLFAITRNVLATGATAAAGAVAAGMCYLHGPRCFENLLPAVFSAFSITARQKRLSAGIIDSNTLAFFLTWICSWLCFSILILERKRRKNGD